MHGRSVPCTDGAGRAEFRNLRAQELPLIAPP